MGIWKRLMRVLEDTDPTEGLLELARRYKESKGSKKAGARKRLEERGGIYERSLIEDSVMNQADYLLGMLRDPYLADLLIRSTEIDNFHIDTSVAAYALAKHGKEAAEIILANRPLAGQSEVAGTNRPFGY